MLTCCNAFSKSGVCFISGRLYSNTESVARQTRRLTKQYKRSLNFYDSDLFTAIYRRGSWYFQHFHTKESFKAVCAECGLKVDVFTTRNSSSFQAVCSRARDLTPEEAEAAIRFEFSLPLPHGQRYEYADRAVEAYNRAVRL